MASPLRTPKALEREKLQKRIHTNYHKLLDKGVKPTAAELTIVKKSGISRSTIYRYCKLVEAQLQTKKSEALFS